MTHHSAQTIYVNQSAGPRWIASLGPVELALALIQPVAAPMALAQAGQMAPTII